MIGARRDPLLVVPQAVCHRCQLAEFATDAIWVTGRHILATYPRVCIHYKPSTFLVDAAASQVTFCGATTRAGTPCRRQTRDGARCRQHGGTG